MLIKKHELPESVTSNPIEEILRLKGQLALIDSGYQQLVSTGLPLAKIREEIEAKI